MGKKTRGGKTRRLGAREGLRWDRFISEALGMSAYSVTNAARFGSWQAGRVRWRARRPDTLLTLRIPSLDRESLRVAERMGFARAETALIFRGRAAASQLPRNVRKAVSIDEQRVASIARKAFTHSRLYGIPHVSASRVDRLKEQWARNYFTGKRGDAMYVATEDGEIAGFALLIELPSEVRIDLIAVAPRHRGKGVGKRLVQAVWCAARGRDVVVQTQRSNISANRLYQSAGFDLEGTDEILHGLICLGSPPGEAA